MYQVVYDINLKDIKFEKSLIDSIRVINGNLPVICSVEENNQIVL